ncbi:unnamed protein product, partial [Closterium sp. NIES-53]
NPGKAHLKVYGSNGLLIERITTRSPFNSPNTDSIQLSKIENGIIRNSHLQGGDDNVAINDGCHNMLIENLVCINGHGVSIGSLGEDRETGCVSDVLVRSVSFIHGVKQHPANQDAPLFPLPPFSSPDLPCSSLLSQSPSTFFSPFVQAMCGTESQEGVRGLRNSRLSFLLSPLS